MAIRSNAPSTPASSDTKGAVDEARFALDAVIETEWRAAALSDEERTTLDDARALLSRLSGEADADARGAPGKEAQTRRLLYFDVSDLLGYYPYNRLPTGVQRVQVNTVLAILDEPADFTIGLCCFSEGCQAWVEVPVAPFRAVCEMSVAGGDATAPDWLAEVAMLRSKIQSAPPLAFGKGAFLVNLGTSWWVTNYFVYLRDAKRRYGIRYVPFVHDMIPVLFPDYCIYDLVCEFIDWLVGVVQHADVFLANSDATKADLIALSARLGRSVAADEVAVVPLAAEPVPPQSIGRDTMLGRRGLKPGSFVVFVSTIEARKNQMGALDAWQHLIAVHGAEKVPMLVCVGKRGYRSDMVLGRLDATPDLRARVLVLDGINDDELNALYDGALFTIYPSFYEGWGLPVTESLGHGKVPLVANNSSLPQAGGGFAMTFETGSLTQFVERLETLIFDKAERERREAAIRARYRPRSWRDVSRGIAAALGGFGETDLRAAETVLARPGYYPLVRNRAQSLDHLALSGETLRAGTGWWRLEDFGSWTRSGGGRLAMRTAPGAAKVALKLVGLPDRATPYTISLNDGAVILRGDLAKLAVRWVSLELPEASRGTTVTIDITSQLTSRVGGGDDPIREVGIGVGGIYLYEAADAWGHFDLVEAIALGALQDRTHPVTSAFAD